MLSLRPRRNSIFSAIYGVCELPLRLLILHRTGEDALRQPKMSDQETVYLAAAVTIANKSSADGKQNKAGGSSAASVMKDGPPSRDPKPYSIFAGSVSTRCLRRRFIRWHNYGLDLFLLAVDESITSYRDDSLETVKRNEILALDRGTALLKVDKIATGHNG
ncbi:hypothetical protein TB1_031226 [Malus domestica]